MAEDLPRSDYPALDLRFEPNSDTDSVEARLHAVLDDFQPLAIQEHESTDGWLVFFREADHRDLAAAALQQLPQPAFSVTSVDVPDEDWARRSQANLTAITVGRITVAPPWDVPGLAVPAVSSVPDPGCRKPDSDTILVIIDPSTGFGTGHHQTTRLCLLLLQSIHLAGRTVIDVGTGSGVLAIAAAKLGAASVVAMDNDPDALQNARENIERNRVRVEVSQADLRHFSTPPADVVVANLTAAVLQKNSSALRKLLRPGGVLIGSGFVPADLPEVVTAIGGERVHQETDGEWTAILLHVNTPLEY